MIAMRAGLLLMALQSISGPSFGAPTQQIEVALQRALDEAAPVGVRQPGVLASVSAPSLGLQWSGAAGRIERDKSGLLDPNQSYRIASVTKVFTAAAVFRLIETGRLGLYDPISIRISPETAATLRVGGYDPAAISIQQLLAHTSGLYDYAMDPVFAESVVLPQNQHKHWTRAEQITFAMQHGKAVGRPGERYSYSDTGYIILGEIIERASGQPMAKYIRESLRFNSLGLHATYFELLEPAPAGIKPQAHQYLGAADMTSIDASFDLYGGGGLVSTSADLNRFFTALFNGKIFDHTRTLASALTTVNAKRTGNEPLQANLLAPEKFGKRTCLGHEGFWGITSFYCPDIDVAVTFTLDEADESTDGGPDDRRAKLIAAMAAALDTGLGTPTVCGKGCAGSENHSL